MTVMHLIPTRFRADVPQQVVGWATDRRHASLRPLWRVTFSMSQEGSLLRLERRFIGVTQEPVSREVVYWHVGDRRCVSVNTCQDHLSECANAAIGEQAVSYSLSRGEVRQRRREKIRLPMLPLGAVPIFCAANSTRLLAGETLKARYPVLKVMRSATVVLKRVASKQSVAIAVTPQNPLLRMLFGSTVFHFTPSISALVGYNGLLDPRDRAHSGRWIEYFGAVALEEPLTLPVEPQS